MRIMRIRFRGLERRYVAAGLSRCHFPAGMGYDMKTYTWAEPNTDSGFPIAKPGIPFIAASVFSTVICAVAGLKILTALLLGLTIFVCWFFRDPDRVIPLEEGALVSPADGKVVVAEINENPPFGDGPAFQISIFMNVFNVHVNRIPFDGTVKDVCYFPGRFMNASLDKASSQNERNAILIETPEGRSFWTVQIAGLVARRIVCKLDGGDAVKKGRRFGMIRFGSRLDLYLPVDFESRVSLGEKTQAGTTTLGILK